MCACACTLGLAENENKSICLCFLNRAKDWGKTEYKVIRNWTPRIPQPASNQSQQSPGHSAVEPTHDILDEIEDNERGDNTSVELQVVFPLHLH